MDRDRWTWVLLVVATALVALFCLVACVHYESDQTANSGGRVVLDLFPCRSADQAMPVGGNTGSPNITTRGGNADAGR